MCAGHAVGAERMLQHIHEDPEAVKQGMQIVTDSLMSFVKGCIHLGVDGFYTSTQGGETHRLADPVLFNDLVRPYDLALMNEINRACVFNILHICDYAGNYDDLQRFLDYPGHVVNCPLRIGGRSLSGQEATSLFGRPYMGGMDRKGILTSGTPTQVREAAIAPVVSSWERIAPCCPAPRGKTCAQRLRQPTSISPVKNQRFKTPLLNFCSPKVNLLEQEACYGKKNYMLVNGYRYHPGFNRQLPGT
jgi:hypothetical protein